MLSRIARSLLILGNKRPNLMVIPSELYSLQQQLRNQATLSLSACKKYLVVDDEENKLSRSEFPLIWLRDNCQCSKCFHPEVNRRILDYTSPSFKFGQELTSFRFNESEDSIQLNWDDGHESKFKLNFFMSHKFDKATSEHYLRTNYRLPRKAWSKNDVDFSIPRYNFEEILTDPEGKEAKRWLTGLCQDGMAIMENTKMRNRAELLGEFIKATFGFSKETHYGKEFLVQNRLSDITNIAYLNGNLQSHTDLPYYDYVPGTTLLHFLRQSIEGGSSTLVDGLKIAERIRQEDPGAFEILSTLPVNWVDKGVENGLKFHKILITPVFGLKNGELDRVTFSVPQRDSMFSVDDPKCVQRWYEAMQLFLEISKQEIMEFKMKEGDFLAFDNARLMHGRTAYEANEQRIIVGCYVDWDEIYSKLRANEN